MTRVVALPYLTAGPARLLPGAWVGTDGQRVDALTQWDYGTEVRASRTLGVDLAGVRKDCDFDPQVGLGIAVIWRASSTAARGVLPVVDLPIEADEWSGDIELRLKGSELGGQLRLVTRLILTSSPATRPSRVTPHLVGSILWEDRHSIALEGGGARFPMEAVDFAVARLPAAGAAWYLHWPREDLSQPVLGALRLYVNDAHPAIHRLLSGELGDGEAAAVVSTMRYDVVRGLVEAVLLDDEFVEEPDAYEDGSVGGLLRRLLNAYWPDQTPVSLRNNLRSRPDVFTAELQERLRLLQDIV